MEQVLELLHHLHREPELSGAEGGTARAVTGFFDGLQPDRTLADLGGHGVAFVFDGAQPGPTVLLRCELDALPIQERHEGPGQSRVPGVAHQCGHDGHMAILAAVGTRLARRRPARGRVVLLFQGAEETGEGAAAVVADPRFAELGVDLAFALHNVPGHPLGQVIVREGSITSASRGMEIELSGRTAHAAQPETGVSPALAMSRLVETLASLESGLVPDGEIAFATVVGARLGEKAFGTAPGEARVWVTLRSETDPTMARLIEHAEQTARRLAERDGLELAIGYQDIFPATVNAAEAVGIVRAAATPGRLRLADKPFRWSEDFGHITAAVPGALFGIGAGEDRPDLHNPDYRFPEALIPEAADLFVRILDAALG